MKVVRLSVVRICRLYLPGNIPGTHFCYRLSRNQGQNAAISIMSMNSTFHVRLYYKCMSLRVTQNMHRRAIKLCAAPIDNYRSFTSPYEYIRD